MANTPKLTMPEIAASQSSKEVTHNASLRDLDCLVQATAIDKDLSDAPGAPSDGDTYIVGPSPTSGDDWDGYTDDIAYYESSAWTFHTPDEGWQVYVQDEAKLYTFTSASIGWETDESILGSDTYDVAVYKPGQPTAAEVIFRFTFVRDILYADDFSGSAGALGAGPDASAGVDFIIKNNGSQIGLISYASGATTATFTTDSAAETLSAGDVLTVVAPDPQDATLSGVSFTLKGTKV